MDINIEKIQELLLDIRGEKVILDSDVAQIYGVETKDINKAVKIIQINSQMIIFLIYRRMNLMFCGGNFPPQNYQKQERFQKPV